jgi:hypothetical protein
MSVSGKSKTNDSRACDFPLLLHAACHRQTSVVLGKSENCCHSLVSMEDWFWEYPLIPKSQKNWCGLYIEPLIYFKSSVDYL